MLYQIEENFKNWTSENDKIDIFIQKMQLKIKIDDNDSSDIIIFEWIPYNQFSNIKEIFKSTIYSCKWNDGPLYWNSYNNKFMRKFDIKVILKCLYNSQNTVDEFLNKV